jgi:hypothetical protein
MKYLIVCMQLAAAKASCYALTTLLTYPNRSSAV